MAHDELEVDAQGEPPPDPGVEVLDAAAPTAPKLVLLGDVATMVDAPLRDGAVYMEKGVIVAVQPAAAAAPAGFADAPRVSTGGVIYPGLADLHNHLPYNILSLWSPALARTNRSQWLRDPEYKRLVSMPMEVVARRQDLLRALVRYVEVKLILGGVTSGQGMHTKFGGGGTFHGLVRNFEQPDDPVLRPIRHKITDLKEADVGDFRGVLGTGAPYFFHLAEGTDQRARAQYELLNVNDLVRANLVAIHSLGLKGDDLRALREADASVVWSPFSNAILYGRSIPSPDLLQAGVRFGLGSDWTPSGSRNMLQEMKIASLSAKAGGAPLTAERLAKAVTVDAMQIAGWGDKLGKVAPGFFSDLLVLDRRHDDVFENLLAATEREVRLVVIAGHPRHGDRSLMRDAGLGADQLEGITVGGRDKALHLAHPASPLNALSFAAARDALQLALADLHAVRDAPIFEPMEDGEPRIEIELDMQAPEPEPGEMDVLAAPELPESVPLDPPTVIDDDAYWARLDEIEHLPPFLKGPQGLRSFYRTEDA